jgi:hypothetical protein
MPAAVLAAAIAAAPPAAAQQASNPWLPLPRPADRGKAVIYSPEFLAKEDYDRTHGCSTPGLQCRFRLLGVIENNGAVELRATAFTW